VTDARDNGNSGLGCEALGLYFDGELDALSCLAFERHAEGCERCRHDLAALSALRGRLRAETIRHPADDRLRARVAEGLDAAAMESAASPHPLPQRPPALGPWMALAAALTAAVLSSLVTLYLDRPSPEAQWAAAIVATHQRALLAGHAFDIASSDRHVVKPWFSGKTAVAPPVMDLRAQGITLLGGRLDMPDRTPAPTLVYAVGPHVVSLFLEPATGESAPTLAKIDGLSVLSWKQQGFAFSAVSDADRAEIRSFHRAYAAALNAAQ
jgi:anti-sigma factor RsiW